MSGSGSRADCDGHPDLADELRRAAGGALDLLEPWIDRIREQPAESTGPQPSSCAVCPVCALITVLRGERSELAVRLAEHTAALLTVLRAALEEGGAGVGTAPGAAAGPAPGPAARTVVRVPVDWTARRDPPTGPC